MSEFSVEADGRGPYPLAMEDRVARLEEDMRDVKSVLSRLEPMIVRIDATLTATLPGVGNQGRSCRHTNGVDQRDLRSPDRGCQEFWGLSGGGC